MLSYALRRLLLLVPVFFAVSAVIFLIIHLVPGDPVDNLARIGSSPEQRQEIAARYGLDRPLPTQYFIWLGKLVRGDMGNAIVLRRPVADLIAQNLPYSLTLGGFALLFSTAFGILAGFVAA
ncbi:MAG TPA: ABC transporter permease, partial [Dongiaceae bacterium]